MFHCLFFNQIFLTKISTDNDNYNDNDNDCNPYKSVIKIWQKQLNKLELFEQGGFPSLRKKTNGTNFSMRILHQDAPSRINIPFMLKLSVFRKSY